jgi:hypothetical protein
MTGGLSYDTVRIIADGTFIDFPGTITQDSNTSTGWINWMAKEQEEEDVISFRERLIERFRRALRVPEEVLPPREPPAQETRTPQGRRPDDPLERSKAILMSYLSPENRERLNRGEQLEIEGSHGGGYRIRTSGYSGNIYRFRVGNSLEYEDRHWRGQRVRFCCHPLLREHGQMLPHWDVILSQILMIQYDEPGFLRTTYLG